MTAMDGGARLDEGPAAMNSVLEWPRADGRARPFEEIFPLRGDVDRARLMQETWCAFAGGMAGAVEAAFGDVRSPPEIAYAIGEIVHNYFRTRGVTLTSYELRRLVAELLAQRDRGRRQLAAGPLIRFASEPFNRTASWTGADAGVPPVVTETVFAGPPSDLLTVTPRDIDAGLMADLAAKVRARLAGDPFGLPRGVVVEAIASALDVIAGPRSRERDRLWADRSISAVFVNGPASIYVERDGVVELSQERFRDRAQLDEIVGRLVRREASPDRGDQSARRQRRRGAVSAGGTNRSRSDAAARRRARRPSNGWSRPGVSAADGRPAAHRHAQSPNMLVVGPKGRAGPPCWRHWRAILAMPGS